MPLETPVVDATKTPADAVVTPPVVPTAPVVDTPVVDANDDLTKAIAARQKAKDDLRKERQLSTGLQTKLDDIEKNAAVEQGKYKELYEKREEQYKTLRQSWMRDKVRLNLADAATKFGCQDLDLAMSAGNSELLEFDDATGSVDGADAFFEDLKARKPILFGSGKTPTVNPSVPGTHRTTVEAEDFSKLSNDDVIKRLIEIEKRGG